MKIPSFLKKKDLSSTKPIDKKIEVNEKVIHELFDQCADVKIEKKEFKNVDDDVAVLMVYCEGLSDTKRINEIILPQLQQFLNNVSILELTQKGLTTNWHISSLTEETSLDNIVSKVFSGQFILMFDGLDTAYSIDISNPPKRNPEETNLEVSILGPKDGFVEELGMNVALVRKRLKTNSLTYEQHTVGTRGQTKIGLLYLKDVVRDEVIQEVKDKISKINIDAVYSNEELIELISGKSNALFPLYDQTGRPDYVVAALLRGRFSILLDGIPTAIIAPMNLLALIKAPEDLHHHFFFVSFERIFRLMGLVISLFLPGFSIAISTYHPDQIPLTLLATLITARKGVPIPSPFEALLVILMFELFREAGLRLPSGIGQTLSVVGGIVVGDAAIRAGLTSPVMVVMVSLTAVATFTLKNPNLMGTITVLRIGVLLISSFMGIYGFTLSVFMIIIYLSNLKSFGVPYLAPVSPISLGDLVPALLRPPFKYKETRAKMLKPNDKTRGGKR